MSVAGGIVIFVIIWWCVLFTVLPIGVRNAYEDGVELVPGQADGAPVKPYPVQVRPHDHHHDGHLRADLGQ